MTAPVFVDANIFVYLRDSAAESKQRTAQEWVSRLWQQRTGRTSIQAINEFYVTVTRKLKPGLPAEEAWSDVRSLLTWDPRPTDSEVLLAAREVERRYRLSWWDATIVAAAQLQGCKVLLTEDLQHGMAFDSLIVRNPFMTGVNEERASYAAVPAAVARHRPRGRPKKAAA
ncbi:MAG: PIN domain-containing protein [Steroidobacteraceae bacterium]